MDDKIKSIFKIVGLEINQFADLNGMIISRETLLSDTKYDELKHLKEAIFVIFQHFFVNLS